ncbi:MAG: proprotein convertase P-domain-containing protein, partial [Phycisphaerae bacterium]
VFATAGPCTEVCVTSILPPGTWWLFAAPQFLGTVPCQRIYNARVFAPAPRGACCVGVGLANCIITDEADCDAQNGVYLGDDTNCAGGFVNEYSSGIVNVAITDNATSTSTLTVTDPNIITPGELACGVLIQHTFQGDLRLTLTSPSGTTITLMDRPGQPEVGTFGYGNDDLGNPATGDKFYFVDGFARYDVGSAGVPVNQPTGNWGPDQPLATFAGEDKGGTWTLTVSDNAGGDVGAIIEWCIAKVGVGPCPPADPCANYLRGDANGDGVVNNFDIDAFVLAVVDPATYIATFCGGDPLCMICRCDINQDGVVNNFDIDPFVVCVVNGACP